MTIMKRMTEGRSHEIVDTSRRGAKSERQRICYGSSNMGPVTGLDGSRGGASRLIVCTLIGVLVLTLGMSAAFADPEKSVSAPSALENDLTYLFSFSDSKSNDFDPSRVRTLIDFVSEEKREDVLYRPADRDGMEGAYFENDVHAELDKVLAYNYHPDVPGFLMRPMSIRYSGWREASSTREDLLRICRAGTEKTPLVVRGVEYQENTPDSYSGGYYNYDSHRTLIKFELDGREVLLSISKQVAPSAPGKKGVIIGRDEDWNYFYSGEKGLTKEGLGWASTYVYDSMSVFIYCENDHKSGVTRAGGFSWLKAGWMSINVVSSSHIRSGLERSLEGLRQVVEAASLPEPKEFAEIYEEVQSLSERDLRERMRPYGRALKRVAQDDPVLSRDEFACIISKDNYLEMLSKKELESLFLVEYLKRRLGKTSLMRDTAITWRKDKEPAVKSR